jgi:phage baseplate assembly protein W
VGEEMNGTDSEKAFLGQGWAFPPCVEADGEIEIVAYEEDIRQAILIILRTNYGERVMRPDFGAGLDDFVFEPLSETTKQLVKQRVEESLIDWEPRIVVEEVSVNVDQAALGKLLIAITYRVRATNTLHNLVYPFYLQEGSRS